MLNLVLLCSFLCRLHVGANFKLFYSRFNEVLSSFTAICHVAVWIVYHAMLVFRSVVRLPRPACSVALHARLLEIGLWAPNTWIRAAATRPYGQFRQVLRRGLRSGCHVRNFKLHSHSDKCSTIPSSVSVSVSTGRPPLAFGCLNIRSLLTKFDDVIEICRDHRIDLLCLTESWHDSDSSVLGRLRAASFNVIDCPRPRTTDDVSVNHGGIVVCSSTDVVLSRIAISDQPSTFELLCFRAVAGQFATIVIVLYRPGAAAVHSLFFDELAVILDQFTTCSEPIYIVGDLNIRLDRSDDPNAMNLHYLVGCYGLIICHTGPTHQRGGTLDVIISREGDATDVCTLDVGVSDHSLLRWVTPVPRVASTPTVVNSRAWRRLCLDDLRSALLTSRLCSSVDWPDDLDAMAALYNTELVSILDEILPAHPRTTRPRLSDVWFDHECRSAKRLSRRLERAFKA